MKRYLLALVLLPWTLWCALVFALALAIAFPVLLIVISSRNERWIRRIHDLPPAISRLVLKLWGIRLVIHNKHLIESERQLIYVSNHMSYLDALVAGATIPNYVKFLGKAEILKWPVLGYMMKHLYVSVQRDDKDWRAWSMEQMREKIADGASMFICPEGTCNTTNEFFKTFYDGAFKLSITTGLPLVPLTFTHTGEILPRSLLYIRPGTVHVYWHLPIPPGTYNLEQLEDFKTEVRELIRTDLLLHFPNGNYEENE